jgi:large subunit ribosomal protein L10Ae
MAKIDSETLLGKIEDMLAFSRGEEIMYRGENRKGKKRNFRESVEVQIHLKNFDPVRDKKFKGSVELPFCPRPEASVCVLGTEEHCEEARAIGIDCMNEADMKKLKRDKKLVKALAQRYDFFLASKKLVRRLTKLLGPGLLRAGKFPSVIGDDDTVAQRAEAVRSTVNFQMKKTMNQNLAVGNVEMSADEIQRNIRIAVDFLITLLKRKWQNIDSIGIKGSMTPYFSLY